MNRRDFLLTTVLLATVGVTNTPATLQKAGIVLSHPGRIEVLQTLFDQADRLDNLGMYAEADIITQQMQKIANEWWQDE